MKPGCAKCFKVAERNGNEYICPSCGDVVAQIPTALSVEEQNELLKKVAESYARIINDLEEDCERYFDQRNRLIECLLFYERLARGREVNDGGRRARTLLAEIGVRVGMVPRRTGAKTTGD